MYTYAAGTHKLYINGALVKTSTSAVQAGNLDQIYINGFPGAGASETSDSSVEDFAIYSRELSHLEIANIASSGIQMSGVYDGLLALYFFQSNPEGTAQNSAIDFSGAGRNLSFSGTGQPPVVSSGNGSPFIRYPLT
jgi:hypothetical protein